MRNLASLWVAFAWLSIFGHVGQSQAQDTEYVLLGSGTHGDPWVAHFLTEGIRITSGVTVYSTQTQVEDHNETVTKVYMTVRAKCIREVMRDRNYNRFNPNEPVIKTEGLKEWSQIVSYKQFNRFIYDIPTLWHRETFASFDGSDGFSQQWDSTLKQTFHVFPYIPATTTGHSYYTQRRTEPVGGFAMDPPPPPPWKAGTEFNFSFPHPQATSGQRTGTGTRYWVRFFNGRPSLNRSAAVDITAPNEHTDPWLRRSYSFLNRPQNYIGQYIPLYDHTRYNADGIRKPEDELPGGFTGEDSNGGNPGASRLGGDTTGGGSTGGGTNDGGTNDGGTGGDPTGGAPMP